LKSSQHVIRLRFHANQRRYYVADDAAESKESVRSLCLRHVPSLFALPAADLEESCEAREHQDHAPGQSRGQPVRGPGGPWVGSDRSRRHAWRQRRCRCRGGAAAGCRVPTAHQRHPGLTRCSCCCIPEGEGLCTASVLTEGSGGHLGWGYMGRGGQGRAGEGRGGQGRAGEGRGGEDRGMDYSRRMRTPLPPNVWFVGNCFCQFDSCASHLSLVCDCRSCNRLGRSLPSWLHPSSPCSLDGVSPGCSETTSLSLPAPLP
jgi:hypothetical protein